MCQIQEEVERQKTDVALRRLTMMVEKGEIEEFDELSIIKDQLKNADVNQELMMLRRENERYKRLFPNCSKCSQPFPAAELNQYDWCPECNQENKEDYVEDVDFEVVELDEDDCPV